MRGGLGKQRGQIDAGRDNLGLKLVAQEYFVGPMSGLDDDGLGAAVGGCIVCRVERDAHGMAFQPG